MPLLPEEGLEFDDLDAFAENCEWQSIQRGVSTVTPQDVLDFICVPPILAQVNLQNNLYRVTYPQNQRRRSLLDYPFNTLHDYYDSLPCDIQYNVWFFCNSTLLDNFTRHGTNITSYWNFEALNFLIALDDFDLGLNIPNALELFGLMKMQEARAGFMLEAYKRHGPWNIEARMPFYYYERNFFLNEDEKMLLENMLAPIAGDLTGQQEINMHFVSDAAGFGDMRISGGFYIRDNDDLAVNIGCEVTIPSGVPYQKGLIGGIFPKNSSHSPFNLLDLFQLFSDGDTEAVQQIALDFFVSSFDKLSANLLQISMGNEGHIGFAGFFETFLNVGSRFQITTRGALEYLFPSTEKRFYLVKKFPEIFIALEPYTPGTDPAEAAFKLAFLNEQLINTFIPQVFDTSIYPGFILKFSSELTGDFGRNWRFGIGYDLWWEDHEKLGKIKTSPLEEARVRVGIAARPGAFQNKAFATVNYHKEGRWFNWWLTAYADYTFLRYSIGKDFTLSLRFTMDGW